MKSIKKNINSEISQKSLYLIFLVLFLRIDLVFLDNTPTGGDMGAHIVAIHTFINDFMPNFQINGWSNDWFAGYPLYYFYFPLPAIVTFFFDLIFPFGVAFKLMVIISTILMVYSFEKLLRKESNKFSSFSPPARNHGNFQLLFCINLQSNFRPFPPGKSLSEFGFASIRTWSAT